MDLLAESAFCRAEPCSAALRSSLFALRSSRDDGMSRAWLDSTETSPHGVDLPQLVLVLVGANLGWHCSMHPHMAWTDLLAGSAFCRAEPCSAALRSSLFALRSSRDDGMSRAWLDSTEAPAHDVHLQQRIVALVGANLGWRCSMHPRMAWTDLLAGSAFCRAEPCSAALRSSLFALRSSRDDGMSRAWLDSTEAPTHDVDLLQLQADPQHWQQPLDEHLHAQCTVLPMRLQQGHRQRLRRVLRHHLHQCA